MKIYADTANLDELHELDQMGFISGITTNPAIIARTGKPLLPALREISQAFPNIPVFGQVVTDEYEAILDQALRIHRVGSQIVVKIPATANGIKAIAALKKQNVRTCATAVMTAAQGLLCALAGADYVAAYTGQNDLIGFNGFETLAQLAKSFASADVDSQLLAASIKKPYEIVECAMAGADIVTVGYPALADVFSMAAPLSNIFLERFAQSWKESGCTLE